MDCPACGTANPAQARFCFGCGAALTGPGTRAADMRHERKIVTILFADLVGFTARSDRLDPEDIEQILRPYHARLRTDLERYGGTVEKFIGDAVMAVFGAPISREDDAERAVRAALAIRDWAREQDGVELRIGVNTGEALVDLEARPGHGESMVKGDVVNTAARLQAAAPVNGVLVGQVTYDASRQVVRYRAADPISAKGKTEPLPVWEPIEARSRFGVDVRQVGRAPLVGRERELSVLTDALRRAMSARQPQFVTLVGVPGMGKSRLVWELFKALDAEHETYAWRQGRSLSYGEGVSLWALGEIVKAQAGILESDGPSVASDKLMASVARVMGESSQREWVSSHLRPLIGLERAPDVSRGQPGEAFAAWRRFLEAIAEEHPLVLVFEDLHWADDAMLDFVDYLAEWAGGVPLLVLATARPELLDRRPGWGGGKTNAATLSLAPLADADTARLVRELLQAVLLPAETEQALLERAGGNPLYAEEFVRLINEGRSSTVPEGVQAIIAARLDTLPADDKRLLHQAAVLGKVFWLGALADVSGGTRWAIEEALHRLERRDFIRREQRTSVASETEYSFRHALVRDAAYEQLPRAERAEQHRRVAGWLESLGRPEDTAEMLAHHYLSALEYARAAGEPTDDLIGAARPALAGAGERALALNAFSRAARLFRAALDLTPVDDPSRPLLLFGYGRALQRDDFAEARQALTVAAEGLDQQGDRERAAEAEVLVAQLEWQAGDRRGTNEHLERAERLIASAGRSPSRARVLSELSRYHMLAGRTPEAVTLGTQAIELARELDLPDVQASALNNVGSARGFAGDPTGIREIERGLELALAIDSPEAARCYNNLAVSVGVMGDLRRSQALRTQAAETDRKYGGEAIARFADGALISGLFLLGRWDKFLDGSKRFAADSERRGRNYQELYHLVIRGMITTARRQDDAGLQAANAAVAWARELGDLQAVVPAFATLAYVNFELGMSERAREALTELAALARNHMLYDWVTAAALAAPDTDLRRLVASTTASNTGSVLEKVLRDIVEGRLVEAADSLGDAGWATYAAMARSTAADELARAGRWPEAQEQLRLALPFWREVKATRYLERASFLAEKIA